MAMAEGNDTYRGLAVPLYGNFEIIGISTTEDIMTLTAAGGAAGDFIVCQTSAGTEAFVVEDDGKTIITAGGLTVTAGGLTVTAGDATITAGDVIISQAATGLGNYLRFTAFATTAPTTGLTLGDVFLCLDSGTVQLGVCTDTTSNTLVYLTENTSTFGRSTPS